MSKEGFDSNKRWGNSGLKGHGVNSPAMMEARSKHQEKAIKGKVSAETVKKRYAYAEKHLPTYPSKENDIVRAHYKSKMK